MKIKTVLIFIYGFLCLGIYKTYKYTISINIHDIHPTVPSIYPHDEFSNRTVKILYWTGVTGWAHYNQLPNWGIGNEGFKGCLQSNCVATFNRSHIEQSDIILINPRLIDKGNPLPVFRNHSQVWLLTTLEPPLRYSVPKRWRDLFNATYTYKADSDVVYDLYKVVPSTKNETTARANISLMQLNGTAKKMAAWVVSRCVRTNHRLKLANMMQQHIDVDIYGNCGTYSCKRNTRIDPRNWYPDNECHKMIAQQYIFYLAFENSHCKDYMTEKVWRPLLLGIIPIVYGRANYSAKLPPHSYINVEDFASVKELTDYMKLIARTPSLYYAYFDWRLHYSLEFVEFRGCDACARFHQILNSKGSHTVDYEKFWGVKNNCDGGALFKSISNHRTVQVQGP